MKTDNSIKRYKAKVFAGRMVAFLLLLLLAVLFILPFIWMMLGSLKPTSELFAVPLKWLPKDPSLDNFRQVFTKIPFWRYFKNTMIIIVANLAGSLLACPFVAYGFSRLRWPGRDKLFMVVLVTMILPYQVTLIPLYLMYTKFGWNGTFLPLTVPAFFGNSYFIFLIRQTMIGIPKEMTEAARIDGANEFRIYSQVILPTCKPVLATVAIMSFMNSWKDYLGPLVFLGDDSKYTLSLAASMLKSKLDPNWEVLLALGVLMILPVMILYIVMNKYFVQSITASAVKG